MIVKIYDNVILIGVELKFFNGMTIVAFTNHPLLSI